MSRRDTSATRIQELELQLEEAIQMLRLVAKNSRTCLEVSEWLMHNHPQIDDGHEIISSLLNIGKKRKQR